MSSTDVPLLHPAFVARIVGALGEEEDVVLPEIGGHRQPLAAAYRTSLLSIVEELMTDIMFELPDLEAKGKYLVTDKVVRGEAALFEKKPVTDKKSA